MLLLGILFLSNNPISFWTSALVCIELIHLGKLYGLCKVHKMGFPFRPVVSMIGTAEYTLAKYLDRIIIPRQDYQTTYTVKVHAREH